MTEVELTMAKWEWLKSFAWASRKEFLLKDKSNFPAVTITRFYGEKRPAGFSIIVESHSEMNGGIIALGQLSRLTSLIVIKGPAGKMGGTQSRAKDKTLMGNTLKLLRLAEKSGKIINSAS